MNKVIDKGFRSCCFVSTIVKHPVHCIETFFTVHDFQATCACPEKTELPWKFLLYWIYILHSGFLTTCACPENRVSPQIFHCIEYIFYHSGFLSNFVLALKNRVALEFFAILNILFTFRNFEQLACASPEKQRVPWILSTDYIFLSFRIFEQLALSLKNGFALEFFTVLKYFHHSGFLSNLRLPWKTELSRNVSLYGIHLLHSEFLSKLHALALKNRVALIFFTVFEHVFLSFKMFEQLALALINRDAQKFFAVWNILFTFRIFEQLALALKNRGLPDFTVLNIYFLLFRSFVYPALALKTELPWNFSLYWIYFLHSEFLSNLRLPW